MLHRLRSQGVAWAAPQTSPQVITRPQLSTQFKRSPAGCAGRAARPTMGRAEGPARRWAATASGRAARALQTCMVSELAAGGMGRRGRVERERRRARGSQSVLGPFAAAAFVGSRPHPVARQRYILTEVTWAVTNLVTRGGRQRRSRCRSPLPQRNAAGTPRPCRIFCIRTARTVTFRKQMKSHT